MQVACESGVRRTYSHHGLRGYSIVRLISTMLFAFGLACVRVPQAASLARNNSIDLPGVVRESLRRVLLEDTATRALISKVPPLVVDTRQSVRNLAERLGILGFRDTTRAIALPPIPEADSRSLIDCGDVLRPKPCEFKRTETAVAYVIGGGPRAPSDSLSVWVAIAWAYRVGAYSDVAVELIFRRQADGRWVFVRTGRRLMS